MHDAIDYRAIDFFRGNELVDDPYPYFDWLRTQCPVQRETQQGVYMVTGYDDARSTPIRTPSPRATR
jgi:cytochrome P450 family 150 subfamily A5